MDARHVLGAWGEEEAAHHLEKQGLRIVAQHYWTPMGEIDLVAQDTDAWVFVEVKTRALPWRPSAADAITRHKQRKMTLAALSYMKKRRLVGENMRFDVILIEGDLIEWIRNAFEPSSRYTC
jgi:putative endonuclease